MNVHAESEMHEQAKDALRKCAVWNKMRKEFYMQNYKKNCHILSKPFL